MDIALQLSWYDAQEICSLSGNLNWKVFLTRMIYQVMDLYLLAPTLVQHLIFLFISRVLACTSELSTPASQTQLITSELIIADSTTTSVFTDCITISLPSGICARLTTCLRKTAYH